MKNDIILRKAELSDCKAIFEWRNHESTRECSFNPNPADWEEHQAWFSSVLESNNRHLLIGERCGDPIGVLRYDIEQNVAEISVYVVPGKYGQGLGTKLISEGSRWVDKNLDSVNQIHARILTENTASECVFAKAGFTKSFTKFVYNIS